jgi:mono/diheme cytochrome c family protein
MKMNANKLAAATAVAVSMAWSAPGTEAQTKLVAGDVEAGRHFALLACTGCHLVTPDQPSKPIRNGLPRPPDFKDIAKQSDVTAAFLQHHLETLPAIPTDAHMPNLMLSSQEIRDVVAFIISLRDQPAPKP